MIQFIVLPQRFSLKTMNKFLSILFCIIIAVQQLYSQTTLDGWEFRYDGVNYKILSGLTKTCEVTTQRGSYPSKVIITDEAYYDSHSKRETYRVVDIAASAFENCTGLQSVDIVAHVDKIGSYCFSGCKKLTSIELSYTIKNIGGGAFQLCENLEHIYLGSGVTQIFDYTFYGCKKLSSIRFSHNLTLIGAFAFNGCKNLTTIDIPETVQLLGQSAFCGCSSLTSINIPPVNLIQSSTFRGCVSLASIEIPISVNSIQEYAFNNCPGLKSVRCLSPKPCRLTQNAFDWKTYDTALLYVPVGSKDLYAQAEGWKNFENIIEEDSGITEIPVDALEDEDIVVYNLKGIRLPLKSKEELNQLSPGYYIVNNKITLIKH